MFVSQIITFDSEKGVNQWLLLNYDKDVVEISMAFNENVNRMYYMVHYKRQAKLEGEM
jgi:hypothetical protein